MNLFSASPAEYKDAIQGLGAIVVIMVFFFLWRRWIDSKENRDL